MFLINTISYTYSSASFLKYLIIIIIWYMAKWKKKLNEILMKQQVFVGSHTCKLFVQSQNQLVVVSGPFLKKIRTHGLETFFFILFFLQWLILIDNLWPIKGKKRFSSEKSFRVSSKNLGSVGRLETKLFFLAHLK